MNAEFEPCGRAGRDLHNRSPNFRRLGTCLLLAFSASLAASEAANATEVFGSSSVPFYDRVPVSAEDLYKISPYVPHPGVTIGSFLFQSSVTAAATFDDNVFATPNNRKSDIFYTIDPEIRAVSQWSRHSLEFEIGGIGSFAQTYPREAESSFHAGANGVIDVRHDLHILASAAYIASYEPRGTGESFFLYDSPIRYQTLNGALSVNKEFNRLWVQSGVAVSNTTFDNARLHGVVVDQSFRDGTVTQLDTRIGYEISGRTSVFVEGIYDWRTYHDSTFDGEGYRVLGGVKYEFTTLIRGEFAAGFLHEDFDSLFRNTIDTYTYRAQILWSPTPLITVGLIGGRDLNSPSAFLKGSNVINSQAGVRVDYAFKRYLTFYGITSFGWENYVDVNRNDNFWKVGGGAAYQFNPDWAVVLSYDHLEYVSNVIPNVDYDINRVTLGLSAHY